MSQQHEADSVGADIGAGARCCDSGQQQIVRAIESPRQTNIAGPDARAVPATRGRIVTAIPMRLRCLFIALPMRT